MLAERRQGNENDYCTLSVMVIGFLLLGRLAFTLCVIGRAERVVSNPVAHGTSSRAYEVQFKPIRRLVNVD